MAITHRIKFKCDGGCGKQVIRNRLVGTTHEIYKKPVQIKTTMEIPEGWGSDINGKILLCPDCLAEFKKMRISKLKI